MSTTAVSPSYRLRIAIGLVALKFKPPEQSVHTYVLNLKYYLCRSASRPVFEECDAWRKRALELETELEATRAAAAAAIPEPTPPASKKKKKQTNQGAKLEITQAAEIPEDVGTTKHTPSASKGKGKQAKKAKKLPETLEIRGSQTLDIPTTATARNTIPSDNNALLRHLHDPRAAGYMRADVEQPGSSLWTSNSLFPSLRTLDDITTQISTKPSPPAEAARLVAATFRCLEVLQGLFARAISPEPPAPEGPTPGDTLEGIERILPDILRTAVTHLHGAYIHPSSVARPGWYVGSSDDERIRPGDKTSAFDLVLGRVITGLLLPAIRALVPCTLTKTEYILASVGPRTSERDFVDGKQLLSLIGAVLDALPDPPHIILYDRVGLEAIRELTSLILNQPTRVPYAQQTPAQRIHRIARKDALHFLCDTILLAFRIRRSAPAPPGSPEEMMRAALSDALGNLALTQSVREGGSGLDTVEEHYVMAVLERAWGVGLRVGHIDGDSESADIDMDHHGVHEQG